MTDLLESKELLSTETKKDNYYHIKGGFYIVRTQAGLKQAIKDFSGDVKGERPDHEKPSFGYPTKYPSVVHLSERYEGYHYIGVASIPVNDLSKILSEH